MNHEGYIVIVDLEYPEYLHDMHNDKHNKLLYIICNNVGFFTTFFIFIFFIYIISI